MRSKTGRSLKKFLSFLLTLSMVLGMLPTFALAADTLAQSQVIATGDVDKPDSSTNCLVDYTISAVNQLAENGGDLYANVTYTFTFNTYTGADRPALDLKVGGTRVITYDYPGGSNENCAFTNQHANASVSGNVVTYTPGLMKLNSSFALENGAVEVGSTGTNGDRFSDAFTLPVCTVSYTDTAAAADLATIPGNMYVLNGTVIPVGAAPTVQSAYAATHTFESWGGNTPGGDLTITVDTTLDAVWTLATYPVTYADTTGDASVTGLPAAGIATYGVDYTVSSTVPTRDKYSFVAWELGGSTYPAGGTVPASVFGTAGFTLTATWSYDGPTITSLTTAPTAEVGKTFTATAISDTAEGYVSFSYDGVTKVVPVVPAYPTGGIATVDFAVFAAGTEQLTALQYGTTLPVKESLPVQTDVVAVAAGMASKHTVKFYDGYTAGAAPDASMLESIVKVEDGTTVTAPVVTKDGMVFKGWNKWEDTHGATASDPADGYVQDDELTSFALNTPITKDTILIAEWTAEPTYYDVVFNPGCDAAVGNMPADGKVEEGQPYTIPVQAPVRTDYEFKGWATTYGGTVKYAWDSNANVFAPIATTAVNTDMTLYAVWAPVQVKVVYPVDITGADLSKNGTEFVNKGSTQVFTVTLTEGYDPATLVVLANSKPLAATVNGNVYYYEFKAEEDTTITINAVELKTFTITLPQGDGYATEFVGCTPATANGTTSYTFSYGDKFQVKLTVQPDIKATLKIDGETAAEIDAGATVQNKTSNEVVVKKEHNVSVAIEKKIIRTVTYSLEPHSGLYTTQLVENGHSVVKPADPKIRGYNFDGWYTNPDYSGSKWVFDDPDTVADEGTHVTADMVLYGKLTAKTNTISYDANKPTGAGTVSGMPAGTTKTYGKSVQLGTETPTLNGYDFMGWATSATGPVAYQPGETFITELDANITLYAVWQIKTYTVTMPAGTGYSVTPSGVNTVEWMSDFTFTLNVDRQYAATAPTITYQLDGDSNVYTIDATAQTADNAATSASYTIADITKNVTVSISVTQNAVHTVKFYVSKNGTPVSEPFLTQSVEHGYYATMPAAPDVEGYVFKNVFYTTADGTTKFPFETIVTTDDEVYAYYEAITPQVVLPADGTGWTITFDGVPNVAGSQTGDYAYGEDAKFVITVQPGYDMTNIKVSVNDNLWAYTNKTVAGDGTVTLEYIIHNLTEEVYNVRVTDIERKTVTVTYMPNAKDDVSGWTGGQEQINYYIGAADDGKITSKVPSRTGYTFLGWSLDADRDPDQFNSVTNADRDFVAGEAAGFTTDTTLYAIWKAVGVTASVKVTDATVAATTSTPAQEFEGENVTLKATVGYTVGSTTKGVSTGKVLFYRVLSESPLTGALISSVDANGTTEYTLEVKTSEFKTLNQVDKYYVKYSAESAEGFEDSAPSNVATVKVMSKALKWKDDNKIVIKNSQGDEVPSMVATETYTLYLPEIAAVYAKDASGATIDPQVSNNYIVTWYVKDAKNDWTKIADAKADTLIWTEYEVGQQFKAEVNAVGNTFDKVVDYVSDAADPLVIQTSGDAYVYDNFLYTKATEATVLQPTTTDLVITGEDIVEGQVYINGALTFTSDHLAQYEKQTVTLKATVVDGNGANVADGGKVYFYRWIDGTNDDLLNETPVLTTNGVAELEDVVISDFGTSYASSIDRFYAVFEANETYDTSASVANDTTDPAKKQAPDTTAAATADCIYIKSAKFQVPVIQSSVEGKVDGGSASETTYLKDLIDLTAGVKITFTLKQAGAEGSADYSVVALDGRTVPAEYYDIQWLVTTKANESAPDGATKTTFVVEESKATDMYRVKLTGKEDTPFFNEEKHSMYAKTSALQTVDVNVTVDRDWQYQLNDVVLTAEVKGNESASDKLPTGTVKFYYTTDATVGADTVWYEVTVDGKNVSDALEYDENLQKNIATITTKDLPVAETTNTKQNLQITAVYEGDNTFQPSGAFTPDASTTEDTKDGTISTTDGCTVANDSVIIYSSVVYVNTAVEMSTNSVAEQPASGIYIKVTDGHLATFESAVELTLSDIYTLDYQTDPAIAKLAFGDAAKDYSIEWQYTDAKPDYENAVWYKVEGSTNSKICNFTVANDGRAYRAVVTVEDKPITQGSYTAVDQTVAGRQVYYSNILVAQDNQVTVTTNVNTSNTVDGYEGIVEGEIVTIHTYVAGAASVEGVANNSVTVTIEDSDGKVVYKQTKNDVLGHTSFTWDTLKTWDEDSKTFTDAAMKPGYYTMTVATDSNNGYNAAVITRQLIIRDAAYSFTVSGDGVAYNGKAQGLKVAVDDMDIESDLAQDSVVVYYYDKDGKQVEPTQAGTYTAKIRLQESAYWTEKTLNTTFTIAKRQLSIEDVIVQAKVYDGTTTAYVQEIILKDAVTNQTTGLPLTTDNTGVINGDSVFVTGTAETNSADVKYATTVTVTAGELQGDDAANYELPVKTFTEAFKIQRSQVQGDIADATYKYGTTRVPAEDIYLIDQAGTVLGAEDYTVTYYYHSGNGVKQVSAMNWKGMYTVIARPDQDNYKGGAAQTIYVADAAVDADPVKTAKSALISITNTVKLYDGTATGVTATPTKGSVTSVTYNGSAIVPSAAGRYLVKVTTDTGDTAYGIYTIVKAHPTMDLKATGAEYTSAQYNGTPVYTGNVPVDYYTYTGGTIQGVSYTEPTEAGTYVITAHVNETAQYTSHEVSAVFTITEKPLTITADSWSRVTNGTFPDMTATFTGLATGGIAPDTSLRDVQIQPEMIFDGYDNVDKTTNGNFPVTPVAALARNYKITYMPGQFTTTPTTAKPEFAIHGMIDAGDVPSGYDGIAYFGDKIQLYAYGTRSNGKDNTSAVLTWSVNNSAVASITPDGLLTINGVGDVTVSLKRGRGDSAITTQIKIKTYKQEVKVEVPNVDLVYTGADRNYSGVGTPKAIDAKLKDVVVSDITVANNVRGVIGGQIVTGVVVDDKHQSEIYGGLFTINDAEIVVAPKAVSTTYGTAATMRNDYNIGYTETTRVAGGTAALTGAVVASIADAYNNLDVYDGYEILVAGTENMNYNVKYTTDQTAEDARVLPLENTLKYTTGVIAGSTGRTNGYLQAADKFNPDEGAVVTYAAPTVEPNDRMYGEPNPAMNYLFTGLITGDSAADLVKLIELVGFVPGIDAPANRAFMADDSLTGAKSTTVVAGLTENYTTTTALQADGVKNYVINGTNAFTHGYQNVYQRPFTLKLTGNKTELKVYQPLILTGGTVDASKVSGLLQLIKDNTYVDLYKGEGGLATKLGHTDSIIDLQIVGTPTYVSATKELTVNLVCGNTNYWMAPIEWKIKIDPSMIRVSYGTLGKYSSSVTMYGFDEYGNNIGAIDVTGKVWYEIYVEDTSLERKYSNYKDLTPVVRVQMTKGSGRGVYVANYNSTPLSAGSYVMFAIAEDYTIIE